MCSYARAAVPEFSPAAGFSAQSRAALLRAAEAHLGSLLAKLYSAMPNLAACGFKASLAKASPNPKARLRFDDHEHERS